jgi:NADH dehydrogenase [ubiquinone] 1 alpha subcomplex assembly factor 1
LIASRLPVALLLLVVVCSAPLNPGRAYPMTIENQMVIDFSQPDARVSWQIINDGVMGGISRGEMAFTEGGRGLFRGVLSLENNGGFASVRQSGRSHDLSGYDGLQLQVIGDGRSYQLRLKTDNRYDGVSYRYRFTTEPGKPVTVSAPFTEFEPVFRGRVVPGAPPLDPAKIEQIGFLIADQKDGPFRLEIAWIQTY